MNTLATYQSSSMRKATWAVVVTALAPAAVFAQIVNSPAPRPGSSFERIVETQAASEVYWTHQRLLGAKPKVLQPTVGPNGLPNAPAAAPFGDGLAVKVDGGLPTAAVNSSLEKVLIPEVLLEQDKAGVEPATVAPMGTSSTGAHFTTHRVFPDAATVTYPNRAAGKLYFSDPRTGSDYVCSASVLRHRIVVTAGHCVANASTNPALRYFYTRFLFVPAYRNGIAPLGTWTPSIAGVTNEWYLSSGAVPNAQDVGMLVMRDNAAGQRIGTVTGYLGYFTLQLARNHSTMLGYPVNLDSGLRMQINSAFTFAAGGNNTYIYGNAMRGGSSGGPWIMDYGVAPVSNPAIPSGRNYLISVTSYGPIATEPKYQGASNLDGRFISLLNAVCGAPATGNCN